MTARPLQGVTVLEMGTFITGPAAGMLLADLGADVIKVEQPGTGDPFRSFKGELYSPHFQTYNRNKRSIALDTRKADDLALFHDLIRDADVFIQNFRPGVMERMGLGFEDCQKINPRIIYAVGTGYGESGPKAKTIDGELVARSTSTAPSRFSVGDRVFHIKFGNGNIASIEGNKLTIDFDRAGQKRVLDGFVEPVA